MSMRRGTQIRIALLLAILGTAAASIFTSADPCHAASASVALVVHGQSGDRGRTTGRRAYRQAHLRAQRAASLAEATQRDLELNEARSAILTLGLLVFAAGLLPGLRRNPRRQHIRRLALALLAPAALASYYNFFRYVHVGGLRTTAHVHSYIGSNAAEEPGHYGLYECALQASRESGGRAMPPGQTARYLRSMKTRPAAHVLAAGADCALRFTPERWGAFTADVRYFTGAWPEDTWRRVWNDYGYHPSPIWTSLGGAISKRAPLDLAWVRYLLARLDRAVIAAGLVAILCAFGLETACLCALFFGTGFLWRYAFVGDSYLRHLWWTSMVFGLCALRRNRFGQAGGWLCLSGGLRLFPAAIPLAYTLEALGRFRRTRLRDTQFWCFLLAALATGAGLLLVALASNGRGLSAFFDFAEKISAFAEIGATNKMGLSVGAEAVTIAFTPSLSLALWGLLIAVVSGLLAGIAPAIVAARAEIVPALRAA